VSVLRSGREIGSDSESAAAKTLGPYAQQSEAVGRSMQRYCSRASPSVKRLDGTTARNVCRCTHRPFGPPSHPTRRLAAKRSDVGRRRHCRGRAPARRLPQRDARASIAATRSITAPRRTEPLALSGPVAMPSWASIPRRFHTPGVGIEVRRPRSGLPDRSHLRFPACSREAPVQRWGAETDNDGPACAASLALGIVHARAVGPGPGRRHPGQPNAEAQSPRKGTRSQ
jgi:hypothetical protein